MDHYRNEDTFGEERERGEREEREREREERERERPLCVCRKLSDIPHENFYYR
jgi:hypothetical protein